MLLAEPPVEVVGHDVDAVVLGIFHFLKDRAIERLTDAQHRTLAGVDGRAVADHIFFAHSALIWRAFELAVEGAGIEHFRFHNLRHTAASRLAMRGRSLKEIQEVLGHKSFSMTLRYAHLSHMHLRTAVEALEGLTSIDKSQKMTHKMTHNAKNDRLDEIPSAK
jgi:integrase